MATIQKKIITVFGATGNQGGSVINTILSHPELSKQFDLRGVSRNLSSDKAIKLKAKGVDMVIVSGLFRFASSMRLLSLLKWNV